MSIKWLIVLITLVAIGAEVVPVIVSSTRIDHAVADLNRIQFEITKYQLRYGTIPATIIDLGLAEDVATDPWGHPYKYLNYVNEKAKWRKDQFLKPLNTAFDLYSMGEDGLAKESLDVPESRDDIVLAANGKYVGLAAEF